MMTQKVVDLNNRYDGSFLCKTQILLRMLFQSIKVGSPKSIHLIIVSMSIVKVTSQV